MVYSKTPTNNVMAVAIMNHVWKSMVES